MIDNGVTHWNEQWEMCAKVLSDIQQHRLMTYDAEVEAEYSVNDWIADVQHAVQETQQHARSGDVLAEISCWVNAAGSIVGRLEQLRFLLDDIDMGIGDEVVV